MTPLGVGFDRLKAALLREAGNFARLSCFEPFCDGQKRRSDESFRISILLCFFAVAIWAQKTATVSGQLKDGGRVIANQTVKSVSATETFEAKTDCERKLHSFANIADGRYLLVYDNKQASVERQGRAALSIAELAEVVTDLGGRDADESSRFQRRST